MSGKALLMALLAALLLPAAASAAPKTLVYTGSLTDEKGGPVGGIYWMTFALHKSRSETKLLWTEEMYVAIDRGTYQVELGKERPIPQALALTGLFLSVRVDGLEIHRQQVSEDMVSGGTPLVDGPGSGTGECATCREAESAKRALDCERVGGMSANQLIEQVARKQVQVGTSAHFTGSVGAGDGTDFRLSCPPGFVVTGVKGKAGDSIANLQLVCAPLETK